MSLSTWLTPDVVGFSDDIVGRIQAKIDKSDGRLTKKRQGPGGGRSLMEQQLFVREYLRHDTPYRGLLLYHGLGSGKTCAAIVAADAIISAPASKFKQVFVMLPASLRRNYEKEVPLCRGSVPSPSATKVPLTRFLHYNGMSAASIDKLLGISSKNPFDNSVVVIDEVHNFVSVVSNEGHLRRVYDAILDAHGCKVILMSGTPLVNAPHELALIMNMINGRVFTHTHRLMKPLNASQRMELTRCPEVHDFIETTLEKMLSPAVTFSMVPPGFVRSDPSETSRGIMVDTDNSSSSSCIESALGHRTDPKDVTHNSHLLLPDDPEIFNSMFIDEDSHSIKNIDFLEKRLLGKISYFKGHAEEIYPSLRKFVIVRNHLSSPQFAEYTFQRNIEIRREIAAKKRNKAAPDSDSGMGYRPFTRAICNFSFPHDIPRPYRGQNLSDEEYDRALTDAIARLKNEHPDRIRLGGGLELLSPKYAAIVSRLLGARNTVRSSQDKIGPRSPLYPVEVFGKNVTPKLTSAAKTTGLSIVYSQFRKAEGILLLASILDVNGFCELSCYKDARGDLRLRWIPGIRRRYIVYSNDNSDFMDILLAIFNDSRDGLPLSVTKDLRQMMEQEGIKNNMHGDIASALLITRSGAEGISTRNVREVHIMEPFWHANRIEQVIGRARRAHSHDDLPPSERFVDVYIYMATMSEEQAKLHHRDMGKSSDEYVHEISQRKRKVLKELYRVMRASAVDCQLFGERCFEPPKDLPPQASLFSMIMEPGKSSKSKPSPISR